MSAPVSAPIAIGALDLAALLCSRVCHDLISPVGAIVNGIEVMEEDKNEETKTFALELIKKSAYQASAKLQFCRLAFGAAGSAGAQIDLGDAEKLSRGLFDDGKTALVWNLPRLLLDKSGEAVAEHAGHCRRDCVTRRNAHGRTNYRGRSDFRLHGYGGGSKHPPESGDRRSPRRQREPSGGCPCDSTSVCRHLSARLWAYALGPRRRRNGHFNRSLTKAGCVVVGREPALQPKLNPLPTHSCLRVGCATRRPGTRLRA